MPLPSQVLLPPTLKPLLVTGRPYPGADWADVVPTATSGWALWHERRHAMVFADFGDLGSGMTGVRLAKALRADSDTVRIFLLSDSADPSQKTWARANGADDVIRRSAESIAACLSFLPVKPKPSPSLPTPLLTKVTQALQTQGRIGPAAVVVVEDAVEELTRAKGDQPITLRDLVALLASGIRSESARKSFLMCITGLERADAATV